MFRNPRLDNSKAEMDGTAWKLITTCIDIARRVYATIEQVKGTRQDLADLGAIVKLLVPCLGELKVHLDRIPEEVVLLCRCSP